MQQDAFDSPKPNYTELELQKLNVLFLLRLSKLNARGKCPIHCRITINGQRAGDFSTGQLIEPENWIQSCQRSTDETINMHIDFLRNKINQTYIYLLQSFGSTTAAQVREHLTKKPVNAITFKELTRLFLEDLLTHIDKEGYLNSTSYSKTNRLLSHVSAFVDEKYPNLLAADFKVAQCDALKLWLQSKGYILSYINRHLKLVKQVYKWAMLHEHINVAPVLYYKVCNPKKSEPIFLTKCEIEKISIHKFASCRLQQVADCFLFQCYTGVAYADIASIGIHSITMLENIELVTYYRHKTNQKAILPLSSAAKQLLQKYDYHMPVLTNQKYNAYLKEVADIVGIDKKLTTHVGRKSFTNSMINDQVFSIDTIARMLGHSNSKTTLAHYGSVGEMRLISEIKTKDRLPS